MSLRLLPVDSDMLLRLPSALWGIVGIALIMIAAVRLFNSYDLALASGLLLSVNPYHVLLADSAPLCADLRARAGDVDQLPADSAGNRSRVLWIAFTVSICLAYITHYTLFALPRQVILLAISHGTTAPC